MIPIEWLEDQIYYLPEAEPFNVNFEACGIETQLFITNMGCLIWVLYFYALISLISLSCIKKERVWKRFGNKIYWSGLIALYTASYQETFLACYLNIYTVDW